MTLARNRTRLSMQLVAPGAFRAIEDDVPAPGPGEVLVRVGGCGVCASTVPAFEGRDEAERGPLPLPPGALGHEAWGRVEAVGEGAPWVRPGRHVVTLAAGAFATHLVARADDCVIMPPSLERRPVPGEPIACAANVADRARVTDRQRVAVVGLGFMGLMLVQLLARRAEVTAIGRRATGLELARKTAAHVQAWDEAQREADAVGGLRAGGKYDVVVECAGKAEALDLAAKLAKEMGRLVVAGYHQDGPRTVDLRLWNWRGLDVINAHERSPQRRRSGLAAAVDAVATGKVDVAPLLTHRVPARELARAFELARDRPEGFVKAWADFSDEALR